MKSNESLRIDHHRLESMTAMFAELGKTAKGGVTRLAFSDEDREARQLFSDLLKAIGCPIKIDAIGNMFARYEGSDPGLDPILIGSHGDSQPQGGRYDGIYGVVAGIEVLYTLHAHNIKPKRSIDLVMWSNEEGARFAPAMMGSGVFIGELNLEQVYKICDQNQISVYDELKRIGYIGTDDLSHYRAHAALEIHIEQGPILEAHNHLIGIVTGAFGQRWYDVTFEGMAAHAGSTPMNMRNDALVGSAKAIEMVHQIGCAEIENNGRATVGMISVEPNSRNVVPGKVSFSVEFRHPNNDSLERISREFHQQIEAIAETFGLHARIKPVITMLPVHFDARCIHLLEEVAQKLDYPYEYLLSGAGHDACHLNKKMPAAMIFIPCVGGISHNELESIHPEWSKAGGNMLLQATVTLASS